MKASSCQCCWLQLQKPFYPTLPQGSIGMYYLHCGKRQLDGSLSQVLQKVYIHTIVHQTLMRQELLDDLITIFLKA